MPSGSATIIATALAEHHLRRIAGHQVDQREDKRRDTENDRYREQQPAREIADHG
jgi:hypothetical protein